MAPQPKDYEALLKEIDKLSPKGGGKSLSVADSLDALLKSLHSAKAALRSESTEKSVGDIIAEVGKGVEEKRANVEERQKEFYNTLGKLGKALDKKFPNSLPPSPSLFSSPKSVAALERTIAIHLIRKGSFPVAETFIKESDVSISDELSSALSQMHHILMALRNQDILPALSWAQSNRPFLSSRASPLEFSVHRSQFLRILLPPPTSPASQPNILEALSYSRKHFPPLYSTHASQINRLLSFLIYLPSPSASTASPYADLLSPKVHEDVLTLFERDYCASIGLSKEFPLKVVGDIGGGGALAKIEKGKKIMKERKSEWSQADELPIEIPLPPQNRYHSIFACPVSKEQSTDSNPPMMLSCGHVVSKESLGRLPRSSGRVKCPYCPKESASPALRVYF